MSLAFSGTKVKAFSVGSVLYACCGKAPILELHWFRWFHRLGSWFRGGFLDRFGGRFLDRFRSGMRSAFMRLDRFVGSASPCGLVRFASMRRCGLHMMIG